jgi:dipeptidyl-peptidase-4
MIKKTISTLAVGMIICLIPLALLGQKQIEVSNLIDGTFSQRSVRSLNWMNDGHYYSALTDNKVVKYDVRTGESVETIVDGNVLEIEIDDYAFSSDESYVLLLTDRKSIYRRSFTAVYYLFERESEKISKLSDGRQSYATLSPDNSKVAFTRNNNLFYKDLASDTETTVTSDGKFNYIINGSTDWVYEEELFLTKAFAWSPDSKKLAYYRMDESNVKEYNMQVWNEGALYPQDYRYKYPKAGEENSIVEIYFYDLASAEKTKADIGEETDIYIPRIYWTKSAETLAVQRLNRLQNQLDILHVNAATGASTIVLTDKSDTYIDFTFCDDLTYLDNGKQFLFSSENDGYKHFYLYNMDGSLVRQVTKGEFEAVSLVGLDQSKKTPVLYYMSTEDSPQERHLYAVSLNGKGKKKLTSLSGTSYINMSGDCSYYMNYFSSVDQPMNVSLFQTAGNKLIKVMEDNAQLKATAEAYALAKPKFMQIPNGQGIMLDAYLLKPNDFDASKKYPLLIFQYSGPGSQNVSNRWLSGSRGIWHQMLVQKGFVVAVVDTRGTGFRGEAYKKQTYGIMGQLEAEDHIAAARWFGAQEYIDKTRIGIWGWSYGGYMSTLAMLKGEGVFKTALAVAPFTWKYYDTIYSERYLGLPQDNEAGYEDNNIVNFADKLEGNYMIIHGTGDDNVHFQIAVAMQEALIKAGKQFDSFYYPDKAHGLGYYGHLYEMMTTFILNKL